MKIPNISIKEMVCPHVYKKYGDAAEKFLDENLMRVMDVIRNKIVKAPMIINNGTTLTQRGLRCNICQLCADKTKAGKLYLTAHFFGKGMDFTSTKYTPKQLRELILKNEHLLPCKIRMESEIDAPTWVHIDVLCAPDQKEKVYVFRA